jgi:TnpA family transposase
VIGINNSEALYVIDALCHHETDLEIESHATDTGGVSEHVFALCALGAPRRHDVRKAGRLHTSCSLNTSVVPTMTRQKRFATMWGK